MSLLLSLWATVAALFSAVASVRVLRARKHTEASAPAHWPPVLLLRPVDAPTAKELENLAAPVDYPALTQVVLSPSRHALPSSVRWHPSDPRCGNRKAGHLLHALDTLELEGQVVLAVDADVRVDGALVRGLVSPLLSGAALSTAAPWHERGSGWASRAVHGLLAQTHHSFRALHAMRAGAPALCGKALGFSPSAARALRGLEEHIGEDLELGRRVHASGGRVALSAAPARVPASAQEPLAAAVERFARWMQVLRAHRPGLFPSVPLLFCPTPVLLFAAAWAPSWPLAVALAVLLAARTGLAWALTGMPSWAWLAGELLLVCALLRSLTRSTVTWRGRTFRLQSGGRMTPVRGGP